MPPQPLPRVSEADLSVLGPLAEHRILIVPQIALILGVTGEAAARRMRRLRTAGLVSYGPVFTGGPGIASITRTGLKAIGRSQPEPSFEPGGYRHDVGVGWLWLAARAGAFGRLDGILTEQAMMAADRAAIRDKSLSDRHVAHGIGLGVFTQHGNPKRHYPDLLLRTHTGHRVAIELELTRKSRHRMTRIMSAYASDARIDRVVYLVPDAALAHTVSEAARRAGASQIVQVRRLAPKPVRGADDIGLKRPPRSPALASARARRGRVGTVSAGSLGTGVER